MFQQNENPAMDKWRILDLIADWNCNLRALQNRINLSTDWGPYELVEAVPAMNGPGRTKRILCRFAYHGPLEERQHQETTFRSLLNKIAHWEDAPKLVKLNG